MLLRALTLAAVLLVSANAVADPKFEAVNSDLITGLPQANDYYLGNKEAPVKIVEYASMSCPHCGAFHHDIYPTLKKNYIDTGKVLFVFRPFPLNESALKASMLIDCIGEKEGKERYFTFITALFEGQNKWAYDANFMQSLETFARVGGVSKEMFDQCTSDPNREMKILQLKKTAQAEPVHVDHTPYLFIGGRRYDDAPTVAKISAYIDGLLAQKISAPAKVTAAPVDAPAPKKKK